MLSHIYVETDMSSNRGIDPVTGTRTYQTFRDNPQLSANLALDLVYSPDAGGLVAEELAVANGGSIVTSYRSAFHYKVYEEPYATTDPVMVGGSIQSELPSPLDPDGGNPALRYGMGTGEISRYGTALDRLLAGPLFDGIWSAPQTVGVFGRGLRVGHRPATVRLYSVRPDGNEVPEGDPITVMLHPSVLLVPVEVATLYSVESPLNGPSARLDWALEQLDQRAVDDTQVILYAGEHIRTTTLRKSQLSGPERGWLYSSRGSDTLDSIWARCGVQFRLVNYLEEQRPNAEVTNGAEQEEQSYCATLSAQVGALPRHISNVMGLARTARLGRTKVDGVGLVGHSLCVGMRLENRRTLAHEAGHLASIGHCSTAPDCDLMKEGFAGLVPSAGDCIAMRAYAQNMSSQYAIRFPNRWP